MAREPERRVEVEPLSEARWTRIERGLFARLDADDASERARAQSSVRPPRPSRAKWIAAIAVASAAAAAVGALASRGLWTAPVTASASHIATSGAASHVALAEAALDVGPQSELEVSGDDARGVLVVLDRGRVECEVAPRRGRPPFVVKAGEVRVRVVGTRFAVERDGASVHVTVAKGVVEVESHGDVQSVGAGESWPPEPAASATEAPAPIASASAAPVAPAPRRTSGVASRAATSAPKPAPEPEEEAPPAPSAPPVAPRAPAATPQERYESAARIEATDPMAALAIYGDLSRGDDAWSANALFAAARLEADRGDRDRARALLGQYLARFPRGPNAADARDLLDRIGRGSR